MNGQFRSKYELKWSIISYEPSYNKDNITMTRSHQYRKEFVSKL